jgi:hypothetical protein
MGVQDEIRLLIHQLPPDVVVDQLARNAFSYGFIVYAFSIHQTSGLVTLSSYCRYLPLPLDQYRSNVHEPLYHQAICIDHPLLPARLAMLFFILAIGTQTSPDMPVNHREAERYYRIGYTAIVHCRLVQSPTIEGIQALFLMIVYLRFSNKAGRTDMYNMGWGLSGYVLFHVLKID